jgi:hypothetical protein
MHHSSSDPHPALDALPADALLAPVRHKRRTALEHRRLLALRMGDAAAAARAVQAAADLPEQEAEEVAADVAVWRNWSAAVMRVPEDHGLEGLPLKMPQVDIKVGHRASGWLAAVARVAGHWLLPAAAAASCGLITVLLRRGSLLLRTEGCMQAGRWALGTGFWVLGTGHMQHDASLLPWHAGRSLQQARRCGGHWACCSTVAASPQQCRHAPVLCATTH